MDLVDALSSWWSALERPLTATRGGAAMRDFPVLVTRMERCGLLSLMAEVQLSMGKNLVTSWQEPKLRGCYFPRNVGA